MNYLNLINRFWLKDLEFGFTPLEVAVYFRLLERSNALNWKNPFNYAVEDMLVKLRLRTKDPFDTARQRLREAGLLTYENGMGRGCTTRYYLLPANEKQDEKPPQKGEKNTPFSPHFPPQKSPCYTKPNPNKNQNEAHASGACATGEFVKKDKAATAPDHHTAQPLGPSPSPVAAPPFPSPQHPPMPASSDAVIPLRLPFATPTFHTAWALWCSYLKEARKPYPGHLSEQQGLDTLARLAEESEEKAIEIIQYSIAGRWVNLCSLPKPKYVTTTATRAAHGTDASRRTQLPARISYANDRA